jgi:hypothetical protein
MIPFYFDGLHTVCPPRHGCSRIRNSLWTELGRRVYDVLVPVDEPMLACCEASLPPVPDANPYGFPNEWIGLDPFAWGLNLGDSWMSEITAAELLRRLTSDDPRDRMVDLQVELGWEPVNQLWCENSHGQRSLMGWINQETFRPGSRARGTIRWLCREAGYDEWSCDHPADAVHGSLSGGSTCSECGDRFDEEGAAA